jgi:hypothetical protein
MCDQYRYYVCDSSQLCESEELARTTDDQLLLNERDLVTSSLIWAGLLNTSLYHIQ